MYLNLLLKKKKGPTHNFSFNGSTDIKTDKEHIHRGFKDHKGLSYSFNGPTKPTTENKLVYRKPLNIFNYPEYEGKIYRIKTNDIDLEVTDKHRMWVSIYENYQWSPFCFKYPNEIFGKNVKYLNNNTELIKTNNNTIYESFDHYKGGVFCVHVPSEIFYVRYNNKEV